METLTKLGGVVITCQADIRSIDEVQALHEKTQRVFGTPDLVVNCATTPVKNLGLFSREWSDYLEQFEIHVGGMYNLIHVFSESMIRDGYGSFIGLTTLYTDCPEVQLSHYISAKSSLEGFFRAAAKELGPKRIRLNLVSPGMVDTALISDVPQKTLLVEKANTPLKNIATPDEVAEAICFLGSTRANQITGETLRVNGGRAMR